MALADLRRSPLPARLLDAQADGKDIGADRAQRFDAGAEDAERGAV